MRDLTTLPLPLRIDRMKREAKRRVKEFPGLVKHQDALDAQAREIGFENWADFMAKKGVK